MSNYDRMLDAARQRFTKYDIAALAAKPGVEDAGTCLKTCFFGETVLVDKVTGSLTVGGRAAGFGEGLSVYDWLCDRRADAFAAGEFCLVGNLAAVYTSGSGGLVMSMDALAEIIQGDPEKFRKVCGELGAVPVEMGDMGYRLDVFPDLPMCVKFYFGDDEFPPQLTFLWDKNTLRFVRYETIYYIAGCLRQRLTRLMD